MLFKEQVERVVGVFNRLVLKKQCEHFQQVRFPRTKETRHPNTIGTGVVQIGIQKLVESFGDFVGDDVLVQLNVQAHIIIGFDNPFDRAINGFVE